MSLGEKVEHIKQRIFKTGMSILKTFTFHASDYGAYSDQFSTDGVLRRYPRHVKQDITVLGHCMDRLRISDEYSHEHFNRLKQQHDRLMGVVRYFVYFIDHLNLNMS